MDHYQTEAALGLAKFGDKWCQIRTVFKWKDHRVSLHPSWVCLPHIFTLHRHKLKAFTRFIWLVVVKLTEEGDLTHTVSLYNSSPRSGVVTVCHCVSHAGPLDPDHAAGPLVQTTGHLTPDVSGLSTRLITTEPELGLCPALGTARQCTVEH